MDWKIELIVVRATDVDRAKSFDVDQIGFDLHVDHGAGRTPRRAAELARVGLLDRRDEAA